MKAITKFFIGLYVRATYCRRALRDINKLKIADLVKYDGAWWHTYQGVSDPFWKIVTWTGETQQTKTIHKQDLKMQPLWKRFFFSFNHTYRFYMSNWYQIDVAWRGRFMYRGVGKQNGVGPISSGTPCSFEINNPDKVVPIKETQSGD